jgi:iron(III) transport system substrate-binding protein
MDRIHGVLWNKRFVAVFVCAAALTLGMMGCATKNTGKAVVGDGGVSLNNAGQYEDVSKEDLYKAALSEDVLVVYTVSTRATKTKEAFEAKYPGLCVEIRDIRSPDLVQAVKTNHDSGGNECDVVICNDNSGTFKSELVDTGIVVPYLASAIRDKMKDGHATESISFLDEAEMIFYNSSLYDKAPVKNIWELTENRYKGRIYMPNPLRSFSTYAFIGSVFDHAEELKAAYKAYYATDYDDSLGDPAKLLIKEIAPNAVFTNSSDEVMEALNSDSADIGIMVSSKLRYKEMGYSIEPVYSLDPFCGCRTSMAVMLAADSKNINSAKLFIDFLAGGTDGDTEGIRPFITAGTWSARTDIPDGNDVPMDKIDLIVPDQDSLVENRPATEAFLTDCLKGR